MNKAELIAKWGKYCDVGVLVGDVRELLRTYCHRNTEFGVCALLDKFFTNKEDLIKLISTSKNYIGNLRIKTTQSFDRVVNSNQIYEFFRDHGGEFQLTEKLQRVDAEGKTAMDYLKADAKHISLFSIPGNRQLQEMRDKVCQFRDDGYTYESYNRFRQCYNYKDFFRNTYEAILSADYIPDLDKKAPTLKAGTKTSRAFGAFCRYYGFDKANTYNRTYAKYADLVSPLKRSMDFVISANPLDYLMMSNGVSWESCHNIRNGSWKGGCFSYMLDSTSLITFVVEDINSNAKIHLIPKNYRQMIHYHEGMFMQNRLYPAENDGATNLQAKFRGFVTEEFAEILGIEGDWDVESGYRACSDHVQSRGVHYKDYNSGNRTHIFYPHSKANTMLHKMIIVGHNGVCPYCGDEYASNTNLSHSTCVRRNSNE